MIEHVYNIFVGCACNVGIAGKTSASASVEARINAARALTATYTVTFVHVSFVPSPFRFFIFYHVLQDQHCSPTVELIQRRPPMGSRILAHRQATEQPTQKILWEKLRTISKTIEDNIEIYTQPLKPHLPAIGRFLIVVTFLEDALRIMTQWGDQIWYLQQYVL